MSRHTPRHLTSLPFSAESTAAFDGRISVIDVPAGFKLCEQGRYRSEMIWILEGEADVIRNGEVVAHLGAGTVVGEIKATDQSPVQTADVVTTTPALLGVQNVAEWHSLARRAPEVAEHVDRLAKARMAANAA